MQHPKGKAMANNASLNYGSLIKAAVFCLFGAGFIYALIVNPSSNESKERLKQMQSDLRALLPNETSVLYRQDFAKNGGALLLRGLSAAAWTPEFKSKYFDTLAGLGWRRVDPDGFYCKNGMSISTYDHVTSYNGQSVQVIDITMDYSALSKRRCE